MASSLTWIDHDPQARERSLRILSLFQDKESRDELGLGAIRDSFADLLFPGTSTIQTRLRYMLFIPWMYKNLEESGVSSKEFGRRADAEERDLIEVMRSAHEPEKGIFGGRSGRKLKRLPSSVYWSGLGAWGIRVLNAPREKYHRQVEHIYRRRKEQAERSKERLDEGARSTQGTETWHPKLPPTPKDFPEAVDFNLTDDEASFILDRLKQSHPASLLAHLALHCEPADADAPWHHPELASFSQNHQEQLHHGRLFSDAMHGAAIVYNLELALLREWEELIEVYEARLEDWLHDLDMAELRHWSLARLWELLQGQDHSITRSTRQFVEQWIESIDTLGVTLPQEKAVRELVRRREMSLKRSRSRFSHRRALEQWRGASGLVEMTYRWPTAMTLLRDLYAGLGRGQSDA